MVTKWLVNNYVIQYAPQVHVIFHSTEIISLPNGAHVMTRMPYPHL